MYKPGSYTGQGELLTSALLFSAPHITFFFNPHFQQAVQTLNSSASVLKLQKMPAAATHKGQEEDEYNSMLLTRLQRILHFHPGEPGGSSDPSWGSRNASFTDAWLSNKTWNKCFPLCTSSRNGAQQHLHEYFFPSPLHSSHKKSCTFKAGEPNVPLKCYRKVAGNTQPALGAARKAVVSPFTQLPVTETASNREHIPEQLPRNSEFISATDLHMRKEKNTLLLPPFKKKKVQFFMDLSPNSDFKSFLRLLARTKPLHWKHLPSYP